jgi:PadR family transcriptional regulator PadR
MARRPSPQTVAVLRALDGDARRWRHGYDLGQETGLRAGSLYPILMRLADRGLVEASWEDDPPLGRPRRHLYRILTAGRQLLHQYDAMVATDRRAAALPARPVRPAMRLV